ncbi:structural protein [Desulfoluna butyratoxydans]|uniref:Structural protein P5 n=1 Tax=Desulfoluna butyratoxydans TaxID=231438 RepID=A0A4U8YMJ4_9BACT|nr:structural protein [Desulfoluna butyratoxydans]VFQ44389.1 hypothetical protein MSL71_20380 [Desulfoluna butyratoxydans]
MTAIQETRGIRNNNPGNIRHGDDWNGLAEKQPDASFCTFTEPRWGIRALAKTLLTYQRRRGIHTVRGIISRWAPPSENDTHSYIHHVAHFVGVDADETIRVEDHLFPLVSAIILHENGNNPYSNETILEAIRMARG